MAATSYIPSRVDTSSFTGNSPNIAGSIFIGSLSDGIMENIDRSIIRVSVEYTMNEASQLSFDVIDTMSVNYGSWFKAEGTHPRRLELGANNYFQVGRDVGYETTTVNEFSNLNQAGIFPKKQRQIFEIASVSFSQGPGASPLWQVKCYSKAIQQMKRDRNPGTIKGTGSTFVKNAAEKYGLKYFGEETSKKQSITKASGDKHADSLWDVLSRLAQDSKFVLYEVDGYLVFASERFLLHKWGIDSDDIVRIRNPKTKEFEDKPTKYIPLQYPGVFKGASGYFFAMQYPTINVSNNDPRYGDGSITVDRQNGTQIRPGMTAYVGDVPGSNGYYLIDSVSFADREPDPVSVSFRKPAPEVDKPKELAVGLRYLQTDADRPIATRVTPKKGIKPIPSEPPANIFPLPTADTEYNFSGTYPRMKSGIVAVGNIPLYSRPVLTSGADVKTTNSITIFQRPDLSINYGKWQANNTAVIIATIWTVGGIAVELTQAEAISKYLTDGLFLAKLDSPTNASKYGNLIHRQQIEILRYRFPNIDFYNGGVYPNTPGLT